MSIATGEFEVESIPIGNVDNGATILLTGDDSRALKKVFARIIAPQEDERSIILATNDGGRSMRRALDSELSGSGDRASILTAEGIASGEEIQTIEDISDLTTVGMEFSNLLATTQQPADRFRSGIFLCSSICSEVDDIRSVYRFLNSNFLTEIRRGNGIGICALDTTAEIETDVDSMVAGMERSFNARMTLDTSGGPDATLDISGLSGSDETVDISL